jgi:HlyD family secretion protein
VRSRQMFDRGVISEELRDQAETRRDSLSAQWDIASSQLAVAESGVAVVQRHLKNFTIRAPFSGIAISKDAQIGEMISPVSAGGGFTRTGISTIVDMASLEVEVDVNESFITRVQPGQRVIVVLDAYPGWEIPASVRTIIPSADRQKATVKVRIAFDELDPRILPDMGVKVSFLQHEVQTDAVESRPQTPMIPPQAVGRSESKTWVWLLLSDNTLVRRTVTVADTLPRGVTIADGLRAGDWVVADAAIPLREGQMIQPLR